MATITLTTLWLTSLAVPTDSMSFALMTKLGETPTANGQIRQYAGGRLRAVAQEGLPDSLAVTLATCTPDQVAWLASHIATPILARDDRGRRVFGQYFTYQADEHQYDGNTDVTLTVGAISYSEEV